MGARDCQGCTGSWSEPRRNLLRERPTACPLPGTGPGPGGGLAAGPMGPAVGRPHTRSRLARAHPVGPVFAAPTTEIPDPTLGPELAGEIIRQTPFTTVAIGGIDRSNLAAVLRAGAINFAVVREVCLDPAPYDAIRRLQDIWHALQ